MSTRSTTHFGYGPPTENQVQAKVYRHPDGYPDSMLPDLLEFFETVTDETSDTRFNDPSYLAAKWVVWLARMFSRRYTRLPNGEYGYDESGIGSLNFLSVGVILEDPDDIQYVYYLDCENRDDAGRPTIYWGEARWDGNGKLNPNWKKVSNESK